MSGRILLCLFAGLLLSIGCAADIRLDDQTELHFATVSEGRMLLATRDDFVRRMGPFDRASRLKVDRIVSEEDYLAFVGKSVTAWTEGEMRAVETAVESARPLLHKFPLALPATIQVIKTTGDEEGNAAYTRGTAIILPARELASSQANLEKLICHELFHILSRHRSDLRERLYNAIGFTQCDEVEFPPELLARKITNPDAPRNDHFVRLTTKGKSCLAVPILLSSAEHYSVARGGEFFDYLNFGFLVLEKTSDPNRLGVVYENSRPKVIGLDEVSGFFEQVGRNTEYIIHPEEILADNFALLVQAKGKVASPQVLEKMRLVLAEPGKP